MYRAFEWEGGPLNFFRQINEKPEIILPPTVLPIQTPLNLSNFHSHYSKKLM